LPLPGDLLRFEHIAGWAACPAKGWERYGLTGFTLRNSEAYIPRGEEGKAIRADSPAAAPPGH